MATFNTFVLFLSTFLSVATTVYGEDTCVTKYGREFNNVCDIKSHLRLKNPSGIVDTKNCNSVFDKSEFASAPTVFFADADENKYYTLVMLDPDAPNHGNGIFWLHWIVSNIPGADLKKGTFENSHETLSYHKPGPPVGTGDHRYMFVVYEQRDGNGIKLTPPAERRLFNFDKWMIQQKTKLCGPVAAVQFKAHY